MRKFHKWFQDIFGFVCVDTLLQSTFNISSEIGMDAPRLHALTTDYTKTGMKNKNIQKYSDSDETK